MAGLVCLIGPPAVGKSALAQALADQFGVEVFRLRAEIWKAQARRLRMTGWCSSSLRHWTSDRAAGHCLRKAIVDNWSRRPGTVVLDNLPHSQIQAGQLHLIASRRDLPLVMIELAAPEQVLYQRAAARRVCPSCDPDPYGDPRYPVAHPDTGPPPGPLRLPRLTPLPLSSRLATGAEPPTTDRPAPTPYPRTPAGRREPLGEPAPEGITCPRCGAYLIARRVDSPGIVSLRLSRYHSRVEPIRRAAAARGRQLARVDATAGLQSCLTRVHAAVGELLVRNPN